MKKTIDAFSSLLSSIFYDISKLQEGFLKNADFKDISIKELRTIEAIGYNKIVKMSDIAKKLGITIATLTVAINNLEKKSYVKREKSKYDKRVINIKLTEKGKKLFKTHQSFKQKIMKKVILTLSNQEKEIFNGALNRVSLILNQEI